jgi:hypothetical protein
MEWIVQIVDNLEVQRAKLFVMELVEVDVRNSRKGSEYAFDCIGSVIRVVETMTGADNVAFVDVEASCETSMGLELDEEKYDTSAGIKENIAIGVESVHIVNAIVHQ